LETAFRNVFLPELPGKIIQAAKQISVNLYPIPKTNTWRFARPIKPALRGRQKNEWIFFAGRS
jgi:hypothetical protein